MEGIGNLPRTLTIVWQNKKKLWNDFVNADPNEQARIIGRIFGEIEVVIATAGAGSSGRAATVAPELATAVEVVSVTRGGAAVGALPNGGAITVNLAS